MKITRLVIILMVFGLLKIYSAAELRAQGTTAIVQSPVLVTSSYEMPEFVSESSDSLLSAYIDTALSRNPSLRAAFESWVASETLPDQMGALPDPEVMFSYYLNPMSYDGVFSQAALGVMQMFPWPGVRSESRQYANLLAASRRENVEQTRIEIQRDVMLVWYELVTSHRLEGYLREHLNWVTRLQSVTTSRYETGYATRSDIIRLEIERAEITAELRTLDTDIAGIEARFNSLLNRTHDAGITLPEGRTDITFDSESIAGMDRSVWQSHPSVREADLLIRAGESMQRQAQFGKYPMIGVGAEIMGSNYLMQMEDGSTPIVANFRITIPIWRKSVNARIEQSKADIRTYGYRKEMAFQQLESDLARFLADYNRAHQNVTLCQQQLLPRSRELTDLLLLDYSNTRATLDDVISARRRSVDYAIELESALRNRNTAVAELISLFESSSDTEQFSEDETTSSEF